MYRQKKICTLTCIRERAKRASASKTYIYDIQVSKYMCVHIYNQCSSIVLLVVCRYKWQYTDNTLTLRKIYEHASELRKFSHFHILKLLFLSIFCWYFRYVVGTNDLRLTCTDKFPNVPTKLRKSIREGDNFPPAPPGYASAKEQGMHTFYIGINLLSKWYSIVMEMHCHITSRPIYDAPVMPTSSFISAMFYFIIFFYSISYPVPDHSNIPKFVPKTDKFMYHLC